MKAASRKLILGKLLKKSRSYLPVFILSVVLAVLTVIGTLLAPLFIGQAIDCIVGAGDVDFDRILLIFIKIAVSVGIAALAQWLLSLCSNRMTYGIVHDIRDEAFDHIQRLPLSYLDSHPTGDIVSRIITDVEQLANGLLLGFTNFFTGVMTILGALAFMLSVNLPVALVVVVVTPL